MRSLFASCYITNLARRDPPVRLVCLAELWAAEEHQRCESCGCDVPAQWWNTGTFSRLGPSWSYPRSHSSRSLSAWRDTWNKRSAYVVNDIVTMHGIGTTHIKQYRNGGELREHPANIGFHGASYSWPEMPWIIMIMLWWSWFMTFKYLRDLLAWLIHLLWFVKVWCASIALEPLLSRFRRGLQTCPNMGIG